eukprot:scaffold2107_cov222-Pinguiococcus_pyrenoidosus.AAC.6
MLVADHLHFEVARVRTELHHEHGGSGHFVLDLEEVVLQLVGVGRHADALAATALGGLEHDRIADALGGREGFLGGRHHRLVEDVVGDAAVIGQGGHEAVAGPGDGGHFSSLGEDVRRDLVAEDGHHRSSGSNELDSVVVEGIRENRILRRVSPS